MGVKIASGFSNTKLFDLLGEPNHQRISDIHSFTVSLLGSKAEGILHGGTSLSSEFIILNILLR